MHNCLWVLPFKRLRLSLVALFLSPALSYASIELSPEYVFEKFSKKSLRLENVQLDARAAEVQLGALEGFYDPEFGLSLGSEISRAESFSGLNNLEDRSQILGSFLRKSFATGTSLELQYSFTQQKSILNPFTSSLRSSSAVENRFTVKAKQSLIYNALGGAHRLKIESAKRTDEALKLLATEKSEELLLKNLSQFWETYKAHQSLQLALEARKIYEDLLRSTREKRRLGLADAGDLARAEAALESQEQRVKAASAFYLNSLESFFDLMDEEMPASQDFVFRVPNEIPPVPAMSKLDVQSLRISKISQMQLDAIESEKAAYRLEDLPVLNLIGEASWNGIDEKNSRSFSEALSAKRPRYYLGVEFGFRFGNNGTRSKLDDLMNRFQIQKNEQFLTNRSIGLQDRSLERQLSSAYQIAVSARNAKNNYKTLLNSQIRNYRQGRIDLSQLIQDYNLQFDSELAAIEALGNYHVLLHQWAAFKDNLFKNETTY
jgi:outer membrane protein TolC